jgi:small subunit ribosomal protein S8
MSCTDPIADAITMIRNAYRADHKTVIVNYSHVNEALLSNENYVNSYELLEREPEKKIYRKKIFINLRYTNQGEAVLKGIMRISKPGLRVYVNSKNIPSVYNNTGCAIISTNKGVITDRDAREMKVGGEYICKVW